MANEIRKGGFMGSLMSFIDNAGLENPRYEIDEEKGTAVISGDRDGNRYSIRAQRQELGYTQVMSQFDLSQGRDAIISQVKALYKQGWTQQQIATALKISQPTVSAYLRK